MAFFDPDVTNSEEVSSQPLDRVDYDPKSLEEEAGRVLESLGAGSEEIKKTSLIDWFLNATSDTLELLLKRKRGTSIDEEEDEEQEDVDEVGSDSYWTGLLLLAVGVIASTNLKKMIEAISDIDISGSEVPKVSAVSASGETFAGVETVFGDSKYRITTEYEGKTKYNKNHRAIDFAVPVGTPLYSPFNGTVVEVSYNKNGGNLIRIYNEEQTKGVGLFHLSESKVKVGDKVTKGQLVALSGNTGRSTGPHVHFEAYEINKGRRTLVDPMGRTQVTTAVSEGDIYKNLGEEINNPFSIKYDKNVKWEGLSGRKGAMASFKDKYSGVRAGVKLIMNQQTVFDRSGTGGRSISIADFVKSYVTAEDGNDMDRYMRFMSEKTGWGINEQIDIREEENLYKFASAVAQQESGSKISRETISTVRKNILYCSNTNPNNQK